MMNTNFETNSKSNLPFDPNDEVSFYYGNLDREQVKDVLFEASIGTFLIRDSTKGYNQKVLCVKEAPRQINHYKIVHKLTEEDQRHVFYLLGREDLLFDSIANILEFYSSHYLNESPLTKPAFAHKKCLAIHDFQENGDPTEDLYFKKGDILNILEYTQGDDWWKASNSKGAVGLVPVPLIRRLKPNECPAKLSNLFAPITLRPDMSSNLKSSSDGFESRKGASEDETKDLVIEETVISEERKTCPFNAKVIEDYTPSPYEHACISLRKGQIVTVLEMKSMGKWYGQLNTDGKKGLFPFNRVEIITNE